MPFESAKETFDASTLGYLNSAQVLADHILYSTIKQVRDVITPNINLGKKLI